MLKDFGKNATMKAAPALGGGLVARFLNNKVVEMTKPEAGKEPGLINTLAPLTGGLVGLFMLNNKDDAMSYAGAGMIAVSGTDTIGKTETFGEYFSPINDENLASSIDELLRKKK